MKILAIDNSTLTGSVALLGTTEVGAYGNTPLLDLRAEIVLSVSVKHSQSLMPAVERILKENRIEIGEIDLFAVSEGPGSFTGLRIGIATVQGLAFATGKPCIGVSSLRALGLNGSFFPGLVVPMLDARRGEVYAAVLCSSEFVLEETAITPDDLLTRLSPMSSTDRLLFLGQGAHVYRDLIMSSLGERAEFAPPGFNLPRATHVGYLAWAKYYEKDNSTVRPRYVREADLIFKKKSSVPLTEIR